MFSSFFNTDQNCSGLGSLVPRFFLTFSKISLILKTCRVHFRILAFELLLSALPKTFPWRDVIDVIFFAQHLSSVARKQTSGSGVFDRRTSAWRVYRNRPSDRSVTIGLWLSYLQQPIGLWRRSFDFGDSIGLWCGHRTLESYIYKYINLLTFVAQRGSQTIRLLVFMEPQ